MKRWHIAILTIIVWTLIFLMSSAATTAYVGWTFLLFAFCFIGYVISTGIRARHVRANDQVRRRDILTHTDHISILTTSILLGVIGMEIAVRKTGGLWGDSWLLAFHLTLAGLTALLLVSCFWKNGLRNRKQHKYVAYPFLTLYSATFITGTLLLHKQFPIW